MSMRAMRVFDVFDVLCCVFDMRFTAISEAISEANFEARTSTCE